MKPPPAARPPGELLDLPDLPLAETERALVDLGRVNRWLRGISPVLRTFLPRLRRGPARQTVLDLGTGSGQVVAALAAAGRRRGVEVVPLGVDRKLSHLLIGRRLGYRQLRVVAEADRLPFRDAAVDWTLSTLFFHHFDGDENRSILAEMRRVARRGAVVVDLRRSRVAPIALRLLLPLLGVGHVALYDGKVSVRRAWRPADVAALAADLAPLELRRRFPFRFVLVLAGSAAAAHGPVKRDP